MDGDFTTVRYRDEQRTNTGIYSKLHSQDKSALSTQTVEIALLRNDLPCFGTGRCVCELSQNSMNSSVSNAIPTTTYSYSLYRYYRLLYSPLESECIQFTPIILSQCEFALDEKWNNRLSSSVLWSNCTKKGGHIHPRILTISKLWNAVECGNNQHAADFFGIAFCSEWIPHSQSAILWPVCYSSQNAATPFTVRCPPLRSTSTDSNCM